MDKGKEVEPVSETIPLSSIHFEQIVQKDNINLHTKVIVYDWEIKECERLVDKLIKNSVRRKK